MSNLHTLKKNSIGFAIIFWKILFYLLAAFPLFRPNFTGFIMFGWLIVSFIISIQRKSLREISYSQIKLFLILIVPFMIQVVGFVLSSDFSAALFSIEKSMPILIIPLATLISFPLINNKDVRVAIVIFVVSCFLLNTYVLIQGLTTGVFFRLEEESVYNPIIRNLYAEVTRIHLPYLGIWFTFATLCVIHLIFKKYFSKAVNLFLILIALELIIGAFLFSARMAILSFIIALTLYWAFYFKSIKKMIAFMLILGVGLLVLINIPTFSTRLKEFTEGKLTPPKGKPWDPNGEQYNSLNIRVGIVICTYELLKQNWLLGLGTSEVQPSLNNCYLQFPIEGHDDYQHIEYNTHNQYADYWLSAGLFSLVFFLLSLIRLFLVGKNADHYLLMAFVTFMSISFLTENVLARHAGIIIFSFFCSILSFETYRRQRS